MKGTCIFLDAVLIVILIAAPPLSVVPVHAQPPPISRPEEIVEARMEGDGPGTIDPAACYDGASGELIARAQQSTAHSPQQEGQFVVDSYTLALWHLNEGQGQVVHDESPHHNDGILGSTSNVEESDPSWVSGSTDEPGDYALSFDQFYDYANIPDNPDGSLDLQLLPQFTIEFRAYSRQISRADRGTGQHWNSFLHKAFAPSNPSYVWNGYFVGQESYPQPTPLVSFAAIHGSEGTVFSSLNVDCVPPPLNEWVLITIVYDGNYARTYFNNVLQIEKNQTSGEFPDNTAPFIMGDWPDADWPWFDPIDGVIDEVRLSSVARIARSSARATASAELLMNCYDTLVFFDGEHMDRYLPQLATEWNLTTNEPPIVSAHTGLNFYYTYYFKIRTGVKFHNGAILSPEDVEYTFERGMVLEPGENPQWMFYEPLLNGATMTYINGFELDPENNVTERQWIGWAIDEAIESNSTHAWFNLAFPGAYAPLMKILSQTWSSILCKSWANGLGRASNWNGDWGADHTAYYAYHLPAVPPLDDPEPAVMGTGPFKLAHLDQTNMYWDADRFTGYWRGWGSGPALNYGVGWPAFGGSKPAGYVNHLKVTWAYDWSTASRMFLNGEIDFLTVPRQYIGQMFNQSNVRCAYELPSLKCDVYFFQFDLSPTSPYGPIFDYGVLGETGVPRDFFGNATYGKYVRKAFAHCINFSKYIETLGEARAPGIGLNPTLPYYNDSIPGYTFDLAAATEVFKQWPGLWETGFTITFTYVVGDSAGQTWADMLVNNVNALNERFHATSLGLDAADYLAARAAKQLAAYTLSWQADYPDQHNFAYAFYHTLGSFAGGQGYSNPAMDSLVEQGIRTPDGSERAEVYSQIQQLAIDDCPCVPLDIPLNRHFEQTWVCGWYYNPAYPGIYAANLWKWYYTPHAQQDSIPANSTGNLLPYDVNYDGKTNMVDIGTTAASFDSIYGPPMGPKWVYRADFNNDRKIDMKDIAIVAKSFGKTATAWAPS